MVKMVERNKNGPVNLVTFTEEILNGKLHFLVKYNRKIILIDSLIYRENFPKFVFNSRTYFVKFSDDRKGLSSAKASLSSKHYMYYIVFLRFFLFFFLSFVVVFFFQFGVEKTSTPNEAGKSYTCDISQ